MAQSPRGAGLVVRSACSATYRGPLLIHASAHQFVADDGEGERLLLPYSVIVARAEVEGNH